MRAKPKPKQPEAEPPPSGEQSPTLNALDPQQVEPPSIVAELRSRGLNAAEFDGILLVRRPGEPYGIAIDTSDEMTADTAAFYLAKAYGEAGKPEDDPANPPPKSPDFGDLTPAFVRWMFKHREAEARERYKTRMHVENVVDAMEALGLE